MGNPQTTKIVWEKNRKGDKKGEDVKEKVEIGEEGREKEEESSHLLPAQLANLAVNCVKKSSNSSLPLSHTLEPESRKIVLKVNSTLESLASLSPDGPRDNRSKSLQQLLSLVLLEGLLDPSKGLDEVEELVDLSSRLFPSLDSQTKKKDKKDKKVDVSKKVGEEGEEENEDPTPPPPAIDVLLDILLSLLSQPSTPIRIAVEQCFEAFCISLSPSSFKDLLDVIGEPPPRRRGGKGEEGEGNLVVEEDSEEDGESEESDEGEVEEDDEEGDEEEDDGEEDEEKQEDAEEDEEEEEKKTKLKAVANGNAKPRKGRPEKEEEEEEEEDLMDDDAMFRVDKLLVNRLKIAKEEAQNEKDLQRQKEHFRLRALSLLDIFLRRCPDSPLVLSVPIPLLKALSIAYGSPPSPSLSSAIEACLRKRFGKGQGEYPRGSNVDAKLVKTLLDDCLELGSKAPNSKTAESASTCALWILKVLQAKILGEGKNTTTGVLGENLSSVLKRRNRLPMSFFLKAVDRYPHYGAELFPPLLNTCTEGRSEFVKAEAFDFLHKLLRRKSPLPGLKELFPSLLPQLNTILLTTPTMTFAKSAREASAFRLCSQILESLSLLLPKKSYEKHINLKEISSVVGRALEKFESLKRKSKIGVFLKKMQNQLTSLESGKETKGGSKGEKKGKTKKKGEKTGEKKE